MTTLARQNPEASNHGKQLPNHPGLPPLLTAQPSLDSLLAGPALRLDHAWLSAPPRFPTGVSETPVWGTPCLPDPNRYWSSNPQKHDPSHLAFCSVFVFLLRYTIFYSFAKSNHWDPIQSCSARSPNNFPSPLCRQQGLLPPGAPPGFRGSLGCTSTGAFLCSYKAAEWVSCRFSSSFSPRLSIPMPETGGTLLSAGSAVRVGAEQYRMKPTMMTEKDRM